MLEVICLMRSEDVAELDEHPVEFPILHVSRVTSTLSYENFLAITSMKPNVNDWLTATSGIPLHPNYVEEQMKVRSSSCCIVNELQILLHESRHMRALCQFDNDEWMNPDEAKHMIQWRLFE